VVQAANFRERDHAAFFWRLHAAWRGRVFRHGEMGPRSVIVEDISGERAPQMRLVEDDHVVETLAANGSYQSLRIRFCQGLDGLEMTSEMPMLATRRRNRSP
jgi:hypothetical protein